MLRNRRLPLSKLAVATAALALVAACGGSSDDDSSSASEPTSSATSSAPGAGASASPEAAPDGASNEALETYVAQVRSQAEDQMERFDDVYSDFSVTAEGDDTMVYDYTFRQQVDPAQADAQRDTIRKTVSGIGDAILTEMKAAGISDPKARWVYRNPDGSEIMSIDVP